MADERISELDAKATIAATDLFVLMDDEATPDQTKYITGAHLRDAIRKIQDADGDTKIQVEESADEDIVRMDVAGTEAFHLSAIGIQTLAKQSRVRAYLNQAQSIPTGGGAPYRHVLLEVETFDEQNEGDVSTKTGAADATEANKLHDADGGFASGDVGATIWNTTDNTYTTVSAFVDSGELTLTNDIMVDTETYILYFSRITVKEAGYYLVTAVVTITDLADGNTAYAGIGKNGAPYLIVDKIIGGTGFISPIALDVMDLAANDYITLITWHNKGTNANILNGTDRTFLTVHKIS